MHAYILKRGPDLVAGLAVIAVGAAILLIGADYSTGTLRRMGPGYFPRLLGIAIVILGALIASPLATRVGTRAESTGGWLSVSLLVAGFIAFALLVEPAGLVPATFAAVFLAAMADAKMRRKPLHAVLLAALTSLACYLIFVLALGLQMTAFGS